MKQDVPRSAVFHSVSGSRWQNSSGSSNRRGGVGIGSIRVDPIFRDGRSALGAHGANSAIASGIDRRNSGRTGASVVGRNQASVADRLVLQHSRCVHGYLEEEKIINIKIVTYKKKLKFFKITIGDGHIHQLQIIFVKDGREKSIASLVHFTGVVLL